jgi:protein phosphatase
MKVTVGQLTDKGLNPKRLSNEDNLLAMRDRGLYLVADGVGGRLGGGVASQIVVDVFSKVFAQRHTEDLRKVIENTIELCNQKIYEDAQSSPDLEGMATTIALLAVEGARAIIAHVGDSRVYRFDRKGLICLTEDHSEVNNALRAGLITPEQAANHPRRNVISRALGADIEVEPDFREIEVDDRTSFVLCSDGITRHITDQEIARLMKSGQRPELICERMKQLCYQGGAEDNLSVIVVDFGARDYVDEPTKPRIPVKAAQAQAAPAPPRQSKRIEVDLKPADGRSGAGAGSDPARRQKETARVQPGHRSDSQAGSQLGSQARAQSGSQTKSQIRSQADAASRAERYMDPKSRPAKKMGGGMRIGGELPTIMKISLLFIALVSGVTIGVFLEPAKRIANELVSKVDLYREKGTQNPGDPEVKAAFARHLEGRSDEARTRLNAILSANPTSAEALYYLGRIDLDQKKYEEAANRLNQAAKLDSKLPDVWAHLASAFLGLGQPRNAMDALRNLSATPSSSPGASASPASPTPAG